MKPAWPAYADKLGVKVFMSILYTLHCTLRTSAIVIKSQVEEKINIKP